MAQMVTEQFANALEPMIWEFIEEGWSQIPDVRSEIFDITSSSLDKEKYQTLLNIDDKPGEQFENTGRVGHFTQLTGYEKEIPNLEWTGVLPIERKLFDDAQYQEIRNRAIALGRSYAIKVQRDAAAIFNNAVSTSPEHLGPDGKSLLANDHPLSEFNANTWDNLGATGVTEANIEAGRVAMLEYVDSNGNPNPAIANVLVVPPGGQAEARKIAESEFAIDPGDNNAINPQFGQYRVITWPFLTTTGSWFLIDTGLARLLLKWQTRIPLEMEMTRIGQVGFQWSMYARYGVDWIDGHFVYGFTT